MSKKNIEVTTVKLVKDIDIKKPITIPRLPYVEYVYEHDLFMPEGTVLLQMHYTENGRHYGVCWYSVKTGDGIITTPLHPDFDMYRFLEAIAVKDGAVITEGDEKTALYY